MSAPGFTPIQLYHSTTASAVPSAGNLANGEPALNITDGKLYYKNNSGVVTLLASADGASGNVVGPASSTDNALVRFDTTTGKLVQNSVGILDDSGNLTGIAALTTSGALTLNGGTANGVAYLNGSKVLTSGSALTFDGNGFLGIGDTSPSSNGRLSISLPVTGSYGPSSAGWNVSNGLGAMRLWVANLAYAGVGANEPWLHSYQNMNIGSDANINIKFIIAGEKARIDSSGNLLVGTTSPATNAKIYSYFNGSTTNGYEAQDSTTTSGSTFFECRNSGGTTIGSITRVGTTNAVIYNTTSDYRLKTVIGAVTGHGARIDALEPIEYEWKVDGSQTRGFLAHKFQEVYAQSVTGTKDAVDADGNPEYQAMQASSAEVIADLVAEIQSLRKRLAAAGIA